MNGIFGDYTTINSSRIKSIVKKVNDMSLECERITTDTTKVTINNNGVSFQGTREQEAFINKTNEFRRRLRQGETLDDIMVEALALVREAIRRRLTTKDNKKMRPYDEQIEAAVSMIGGRIDDTHRERIIAEMKTGEGKTLVQILVAYLNVLEATKEEDPKKRSSVHIITSNDALARRDQRDNASVFSLLGISSSFIPGRDANKPKTLAEISIMKQRKKIGYMCDVVYATASTIAFDYLDDNIINDVRFRNINRKPGFAIVDEADDILIDQATNPLKLSQAPSTNGSEYDKYLIERDNETRALYKWATEFLYGKLRKGPLKAKIYDQYFENKDKEYEGQDYTYYKDTKEIKISKKLAKEIGADLGDSIEDTELYNARYFALLDCIKAKESFHSDVEYRVEVNDGKAKIVIIDQNIGRKKHSSKYVGGMHEAIEAKEEFLEQDGPNARKRYHIEYSRRSAIKAMFTYPDFLSIYEHNVCGMTGTSDEEEFNMLYGFSTYRVNTRKRNIRIDQEPEVYATLIEKYNAIIEEVKKCVLTGQPVLIGTTSLRESEVISSLLSKNFIRHQLLNANNEEEENQIVEGAGKFGTITVATNMAGRGTDIKLGPGVRELGGLYVIGTSRNKSSRIDRQLMGRAGRQGDPGKTKYFSSLEDDLVKEYYRGGVLDSIIERFKGTNKPIKNKRIISAVEQSQIKRESKDKKIRMDNERFNASFMKHRRIIYENRNQVLDSNLLEFMTMIKSIITRYTDVLIKTYDKDNIKKLIGHLVEVDKLYSKNTNEFRVNIINALYDKFTSNFDTKKTTNKEVQVYVDNIKKKILDIIDKYWLDHIEYLEDLKASMSVGMVNDPFKEYEVISTEAFANELIPSMYNEMITYALNPSWKYGSYKIDYSFKEEEEKYIL